MLRDKIMVAALLGVVVIVPLVSSGVVALTMWDKEDRFVSTALSNMATVGGIVSALNLTATSILVVGGKYRTKVLSHPGLARLVRAVLLIGFITVASLSAVCAVSVVWVGGKWVIILLSGTFGITISVMILATLVFNAALRWNEPKPAPGKAA